MFAAGLLIEPHLFIYFAGHGAATRTGIRLYLGLDQGPQASIFCL